LQYICKAFPRLLCDRLAGRQRRNSYVSFSTPKQHNITKSYTVTVTQYTVTIDETLIESYFTISIYASSAKCCHIRYLMSLTLIFSDGMRYFDRIKPMLHLSSMARVRI